MCSPRDAKGHPENLRRTDLGVDRGDIAHVTLKGRVFEATQITEKTPFFYLESLMPRLCRPQSQVSQICIVPSFCRF